MGKKRSVPNPYNDRTQAQAALRKQDVLRLRAEGLTQVQIAERLGIAQSTVSNAFRAAVQEAGKEDADTLRAVHDQRIERIVRAAEELLSSGEPSAIAKGADMLMKAIARQAKMYGLDAPMQTVVTGQVSGLAAVSAMPPEQALTFLEAVAADIKAKQGGGGDGT